MHNKTISNGIEKYLKTLNRKIDKIVDIQQFFTDLASNTSDYCIVVLEPCYADHFGLVLLHRPIQQVFNVEFEYRHDGEMKSALCLVFDMHKIAKNKNINAAVNCFIDSGCRVICIKEGVLQSPLDDTKRKDFSLDYIIATLRGNGYKQARVAKFEDGMPKIDVIVPISNHYVMCMAKPAIINHFLNKHVNFEGAS